MQAKIRLYRKFYQLVDKNNGNNGYYRYRPFFLYVSDLHFYISSFCSFAF